ncbi:MAG: alkane 1-monooxygenase [Gammaproteobacteria bacterium]|nr:alkane 1-monooxygenase [Gammaproteobacteria bacterium]
MNYSIQHNVKGLIEYTEPKRWLWSIVLFFILIPLPVFYLYLQTENPWVLITPLLVSYLVLPMVDFLVGTDKNNPPEELVSQLEADPHYNRLLMLCIPAHFIALVAGAWLAGTQDLSWGFFIVFAAVMGIYSGSSINTAHEIGHKTTKRERFLSRLTLAVTGYGHFCIEHNLGHHRDVATPEDPASSRMGETIYRFALREIPGAAKRGWREETKRLQRRGLKVFSLDNHILQSYLMTLMLQGSLVIVFGWELIIFFLIHNLFAWLQLTSANYIEHYGLLRAKKSNGKYERCQPHHSWNANHYVSNLLLFQLQRHSDHHANASRSYQCLRSLEKLPELPTSYFGMYLLAYFPALWFRVMDKRLLAVPHINGDLAKVNMDPTKEAELRAKYA